MTKSYNPKETLFYFIFERKTIMTSYRDLSERLDIPLSTLHRVAKELIEEKKISTVTDGNLTQFKLIQEENKQVTIFDFPIASDPVAFTPRQHRLVDYLKQEFEKNPKRFIGKMEVLFILKELYFDYNVDKLLEEKLSGFLRKNGMIVTQKDRPKALQDMFVSSYGPRRYDMKEYADLTKDIQFINEHCDVRQVLIINRSGKNGGVKIASKEEGFDYVKREFIHVLAKLKRVHKKRKFIEKDGNYRLVFGEEKEFLEILK